jgi:hypothetical protein
MNKPKTPISIETQDEAMKIAKSIQKPGQTKEQTKLVAQGIEKGIALYKKQQKEKARQLSKAKKKQNKQKQPQVLSVEETQGTQDLSTAGKSNTVQTLPWVLLVISVVTFSAYVYINS